MQTGSDPSRHLPRQRTAARLIVLGLSLAIALLLPLAFGVSGDNEIDQAPDPAALDQFRANHPPGQSLRSFEFAARGLKVGMTIPEVADTLAGASIGTGPSGNGTFPTALTAVFIYGESAEAPGSIVETYTVLFDGAGAAQHATWTVFGVPSLSGRRWVIDLRQEQIVDWPGPLEQHDGGLHVR